ALVVFATFQVVIYRYPVVKYETLTLPQTLLLGNLFQVLQDAALEVIHLFEALLFQISRRLLAADTAGAEHGNFLVLLRIEVLLHILGKLAEGVSGRIDGVFESADLDFVLVTGVDQDNVRIRDQVVPLLRLHVGADNPLGVDAIDAHGDDFFLEFDLGAFERLDINEGFFVVDAVEAVVFANPRFHSVDALSA